MRKTPVKTAATAANKPSTVADIPATRATMTDPITVIMAVINASPRQPTRKDDIPAIAGITTTTTAQSNAAASKRQKAIYLSALSPLRL